MASLDGCPVRIGSAAALQTPLALHPNVMAHWGIRAANVIMSMLRMSHHCLVVLLRYFRTPLPTQTALQPDKGRLRVLSLLRNCADLGACLIIFACLWRGFSTPGSKMLCPR